MFFLTGLFIAIISIVYSIVHLRQSAGNYLDPVGLAVVFGGTIAVAVMVMPWEMHQDLRANIRTGMVLLYQVWADYSTLTELRVMATKKARPAPPSHQTIKVRFFFPAPQVWFSIETETSTLRTG